jgi:hypothetical protein
MTAPDPAVEAAITEIFDDAPELSSDQIERLREVLAADSE